MYDVVQHGRTPRGHRLFSASLFLVGRLRTRLSLEPYELDRLQNHEPANTRYQTCHGHRPHRLRLHLLPQPPHPEMENQQRFSQARDQGSCNQVAQTESQTRRCVVYIFPMPTTSHHLQMQIQQPSPNIQNNQPQNGSPQPSNVPQHPPTPTGTSTPRNPFPTGPSNTDRKLPPSILWVHA